MIPSSINKGVDPFSSSSSLFSRQLTNILTCISNIRVVPVTNEIFPFCNSFSCVYLSRDIYENILSRHPFVVRVFTLSCRYLKDNSMLVVFR